MTITTQLPREIKYKRKFFDLMIDEKTLTITYEFRPVLEDIFFIATTGIDIENATMNMLTQLKTNKIKF